MMRIARSVVAAALALVAYAVVRRYKPTIVMVTGSVGKTSTKDAVAAVLSKRFFVRKSEKSYNSEFGMPFTILGVANPWGDPWKWIAAIREALALLLLPNHYPSMLVLEVGADRPGDLKKLVRIASPHAVVVTRLPEVPVHVEAYASPQAVRDEEFSPAYALPASAPLIIPADDPFATEMAVRVPARTQSYGLDASADVRIRDVGFFESKGRVDGMEGTIEYQGEARKVIVRGAVGRTQVLPASAAVAAGLAFNIPLEEAIEALESYDPPPGRGRIFAGKNGSVVIDDSYNASPAAVEEALGTLKAFPHAKRCVAVLGDMLELGRHSVGEHERIGVLAADAADVVVSVGVRSRSIAAKAQQAGTSSYSYDDSYAAADALAAGVEAGDVILIKGSQSMRMERVAEALLASHEDWERLPRQEKQWRRKR